MAESVCYQSGFGNEFTTEALPGALPVGQNSPQKTPYGLYAEQLNGTAFTAPRSENLRSWLYRILPSVVQGEFKEVNHDKLRSRPFGEVPATPTPLRWNALQAPTRPTDFIQGLVTICGNGGYGSLKGSAVHLYSANQSMQDSYFYNSDGEFLVVPFEGTLTFRTELGVLVISPGEIAVIPKGVKYSVEISGAAVRGYICENYGAPFQLPGLGPIGANGLANPRDFQSPVAAFEEKRGNFKLLTKFQGKVWEAPIDHSPLDVVAWHGNLAPYKYDLRHFMAVNSVSFDHADPSINTVLTSPSEQPGTANVDFVVFPPRWLTMEHTFRPPYYHRNSMSEYMGLLSGVYEAKATGFVPGGGSLHNAMSAHGPDAVTFEKASTEDLKPYYLQGATAFMFESSLVYNPTAFAMSGGLLQKDYLECWKGLKSHFRQEK